MKEIVRLSGSLEGPISVVMAGVHGNEPCGVTAFTRLLPGLKVKAGTVYFVLGNPNAIEENVRFTEFNLNRAFKADDLMTSTERNSYEYRRAQFLKRYLDQASALLDLHSSFTPGSVPFVICERNAFEIVSGFPAGIVTFGFDRVNPGGTDYYMNQQGKIGICIECGYHSEPSATGIAEHAIGSFLLSRGHVCDAPSFKVPQRKIEVLELYHPRYGDFKPARNWEDFQAIPKGTQIGTDGREKVIAEEDSIILFVTACEIGQEAFYLAKEA